MKLLRPVSESLLNDSHPNRAPVFLFDLSTVLLELVINTFSNTFAEVRLIENAGTMPGSASLLHMKVQGIPRFQFPQNAKSSVLIGRSDRQEIRIVSMKVERARLENRRLNGKQIKGELAASVHSAPILLKGRMRN
ncbi:uncharacterized protein BDCG_17723 [Blastomyces dermatitidis ER-3]|uniref:Uncharacterized protein n=3 Tax=Blastomyces TaxID=229219 RepID=A0A179UJU2_BLAGS|nr:uncharacterized protein BDBG_16991 [Blastomyces gilchristii SLH14081]XP_045282404.1 uncharacterized protein BDCG_17723 [Blastomyces dermatitidis ER-3]EQL36766.1 hypothetical protein BDFG_01731 [Blastomyces dermatitidis ATCC 26199]KMW68127.1 hypothetical protein BDDG_12597 [Blastomyces dermatitidis ATCC 18188]OAT02677.1 hypothetical protein BDCG_17723 [Blastomyces dermatitidis ER-3]OAT08295.1 hypothetical protein BDBG_16991 [Blastomyces gilchristii SLH14081]